MNALVKKEIRLLMPSWIVAVLMALATVLTGSAYAISLFLLFTGMAIMSLTPIGRECSISTFSLLLSQPMKRIQIWRTKLAILGVATISVFVVWLAAWLVQDIFYFNTHMWARPDSGKFLIILSVGFLITSATFTGGLWTTLLLRQIAGALWLTLLTPALLVGFTSMFLSSYQNSATILSILCAACAVYSVGGFLFARWLFFRAQDIGWSGGAIAMPNWKLFSEKSEAVHSIRKQRPKFALLKKEFQLQQVSLFGAAGLLVLHLGVIAIRRFHEFDKGSAGEVVVSIFWVLWLFIPAMIGCMAVAEERRLGVMDGQFSLSVSRRTQFVIKGFMTFFLGVCLGGLMPVLLETIAIKLGFINLGMVEKGEFGPAQLRLAIVVFAAVLTLFSFFASCLARNFLQAIGYAVGISTLLALSIPMFTAGHRFFFDSIARSSYLPLAIGVPTIIIVLLWLAFLNFKNFLGWLPLWRRQILAFVGAFLFIIIMNSAVYNRFWEFLEPVEPAHGPARFSLVNPPVLQQQDYNDRLLVQLPDGRVWIDSFGFPNYKPISMGGPRLRELISGSLDPFPSSHGPNQFISGSNWVSTAIRKVGHASETNGSISVSFEVVGIKSDGTLWILVNSDSRSWNGNKMTQLGSETNWQALSISHYSTTSLLLKKDGTLWNWGTNQAEYLSPASWPETQSFNPGQVGTNTDWKSMSSHNRYAQKADGSIWEVFVNQTKGNERISKLTVLRLTNWEQVDLEKIPQYLRYNDNISVHKDGTLWIGDPEVRTVQAGHETNWVSVAYTGSMMAMVVALKSDGTLWKWDQDIHRPGQFADLMKTPPTRLGIHNDWVSIAKFNSGVVSLAADGSLWYWPAPAAYYGWSEPLLKLPKQPKFLGNVLGKTE